MKKIKSFNDIYFIVNQKLDVYSVDGSTVPFVRFLSIPLLDIINIINEGDWSYIPEQ